MSMANTESKSINYQPTCDIKAIKARAKMYAQIRQFFAERDVLEVETPILSQAGVTDVHLASVQAQRHLGGRQHTHYLQTSPEFAMKRLLASVFTALLPKDIPTYFYVVLPVLCFFIDAGWYSLVAVALSAEGPRKVYLRFKALFDRIAGGVMTLLGLKLIFGMK